MSRAPSVRFGEFRLHPQRRELERNGERVGLRPKTYGVLLDLVSHAGELRTKDELLDAVWGDVAVSDNVLKVCIRELRQALADEPTSPRFIETRHRIGYRFIAAVDEVRAAGSAPVGVAGPFVGRRDELSALGELLDRASGGGDGPRVACVTGEPGLGKTALVDAFVARCRARADALLCCRGACVEQHSIAEPLTPFLDGLTALGSADESVREVLRSTAPTWCMHLPALFPADEELRADTLGATRPRMLRELLAALRVLTRERTMLWVIEDVHWADASTVDLVRHLATASERRQLLVTTYRPSAPALGDTGPLSTCLLELAQHGHSTSIPLAPLDADEVREYLQLAVPDDLDDAQVALIADRTEGHPLYLTSLVGLLLDRGALHGRSTMTAEELARVAPQGVRAMVEQKLAALGASERRLLSFASVQGLEFSSAILAATWGEPQVEVEEQLDPLVRRQRLVALEGDARYRFVHALYRDALYDELVPSRRQALHAAVGDALAARADAQLDASKLARHYELAKMPARALDHLWAAVATAERRLAPADAESLCDHALQTLQGLPESDAAKQRARFHGRRGALRIASGRFVEASDDLTAMRSAAERAGDVELEVDAIMQTFRQLGYLGQYDAAEGLAAEATRLAQRAGMPQRVARIRGEQASLMAVRGSLGPACATLDEVLAELEASETESLALRLDLGAYEAMRGRFAKALPLLEPLPELAESEGDAMRIGQARFWLALAAFNSGDPAQALRVVEPAVRMAERNVDAFLLPRLLELVASMHRRLGALDDAAGWSERALAVPGIERMPDGHAHALLGRAGCTIDDPEDARADEALSQVSGILERPFFSDWLVRVRWLELRARRSMALGDGAAARERLEVLRRHSQHHGLGQRALRSAVMSARLQQVEGDAEGALARLDALSSDELVAAAPMLAWRIDAASGNAADACDRDDAAEIARARGSARVQRIVDRTPPELRAAFLTLTRAAGLR